MKQETTTIAAETHRPYSWWWDSHRPKNSKWVQENLTDMDLKIKAMLRLIEQDADSFAQRAEMYYKKRPELVHLVEEFYRAYRALAERCDHITGELRQIHHSISEALPKPIEHVFRGDSAGAPQGQIQPNDASSLEEMEDAREVSRQQGLKYLSEIFAEYGTTEKKISELREELKIVQEENQKMKEQWSSKLDEISILKEQIVSLKNRNGELNTEGQLLTQKLQIETEEREKLKTDIQGLESQMGLKEVENKKLQDELAYRDKKIKEIEEKVNTAEKERDVLQVEMEKIMHKMNSLIEELTSSRNEEERLRKRLQEEANQSKNLQAVLTSYRDSLHDSQEQQHILTEEIKAATERLKEANRKVKLLEEEIVQLQADNEKLSGRATMAAISINNLEDEVLKLKQDKNNLLSEVAFQVDQKNDLQKQLYILKEQMNDVQQRYQMITKQLDVLGLETATFQSSFISLQEENQRFRDLSQKHKDESSKMAENVRCLEKKLQERNEDFNAAISSHVEELNKFKEDLEKHQLVSNDLLQQNSALCSENGMNIDKIRILENDLHDSRDTVCLLEAENIKLRSELLSSSRCAEQLRDELCVLKLEKEKCERERIACDSQISNLENEVSDLHMGRDQLNAKLKEESEKLGNCQLEAEKLKDRARETEDRNTKLLDVCQKLTDENMAVKNRIKDLEAENNAKEEERATLMKRLSSESKISTEQKEQLRKLCTVLHLPVVEFKDKDIEILNMLTAVFEKARDLQASYDKSEKEAQRLSVAATSLSSRLEYLGSQNAALQNEIASLRKEEGTKSVLLEESQKQVHFLRESAHDLRVEMQYSLEREGFLENEINDLKHSLVTSQDEQLMLHAQHQKMLEEYYSVKKQAADLASKLSISRAESCRSLSEALENIVFVTVLENILKEREIQTEKLIDQMNGLLEAKKELENELLEDVGKSQLLEEEILHLKGRVSNFQEEKKHTEKLQEEFIALEVKNKELCLEIQTSTDILKRNDALIVDLEDKLKIGREENGELVREVQCLQQELLAVQSINKELQLQLTLLGDEIHSLKENLSVATTDSVTMKEKMQLLQKQKDIIEEELSSSIGREHLLASDIKHLQEKEEYRRAELLNLNDQNKVLESEVEKLYGSLQLKQMENTLLKDGNDKIYDLCRLLASKALSVQGTHQSMQVELLKQKLVAADKFVLTKELAGIILDLQEADNSTEDGMPSILGSLVTLKEDVFCLKSEVVCQIESVKNDARVIQDAFEQIEESKKKLSLEAKSRAHEVLKLQAELDAIQHALTELKRKNQTLQDESQRSIRELWSAKAKIQNLQNRNVLLESQNKSLKAELHQQAQQTFQIQEEKNAVETECHTLSIEAQELKSQLKIVRDLEAATLRLLKLLIGDNAERTTLNIEILHYAEEKLIAIYDELLQLRNENEILRNDVMNNSLQINTKSRSHSREMQKDVHHIKLENAAPMNLLKEKCMRLEIQVEKLSEKADKFETKSNEAQLQATKLEELEQTMSNMQQIQMQVQGLQSRVRCLRKENVRLRSELKGELTSRRSLKYRDSSCMDETDIADEEQPLFQEEKEVVVDESKILPSSDNVSQEIDSLLDENRKYWNQVSFSTKQIQSLLNSVQELQLKLKNLKTTKKAKGDKHGGFDMNMVEKQLKELQGQVMQLVEHNTKLKKDVKFGFAWANSMHDLGSQDRKLKVDEEVPILCRQNSKIAERLDNSTEKARALEMELQRIRVLLSRFQQKPFEDVSKMRVPLRAFLIGSRKDQQGRKHSGCGCMRPAAQE
eukprot:TRINITY_DN816_c0_g2_i1.p1 TRINITY_DN816_c0_g2~~TRINITY_DN816_c0_g2_i1.p1  ORF type:complete len:1785 (+),score=496.31 TRINITY_DN816_c0_g2_i1:585-5939(+)